MTLQHGVPQGFVRHVVRQADLVVRATANATKEHATAKTSSIDRGQTSSLEPLVVAILLSGFVGVFLLFVLIGITCKFANKPRANKLPTDASKPMFQPSAAGYGSAAASYNPAYRVNMSRGDVSNPNVGLLDSASPMGHGGRYEEGNISGSSSNGNHANNGAIGGLPMMPSHSSSSFSGDESTQFVPARGGHARGNSTGIEVPGPAAASAVRRNVSGAHPPVHSPSNGSYESPHIALGMAPDGSGFSPGQVFDSGPTNKSAPSRYSEMREARASRLGAPPSVMPRRASLLQNGVPQQKAFPRGPPPASSKNRRSKYAHSQFGSSHDIAGSRRSRIDSVGPGTYRKSMFLSQDQDPMPNSDFAGGSQRRTPKQGGSPFGSHRRLESIGKGDPRRSSRIVPSASRASLIRPVAVAEEDELAFLPSMNGNGEMQKGQYSPYGSSNDSSSPLGPLGPNGLTMQQQQTSSGGGVRMMPYGAGFGAAMPRPGVATTQISSPSSFAPAVPLGVGLGTRQIL